MTTRLSACLLFFALALLGCQSEAESPAPDASAPDETQADTAAVAAATPAEPAPETPALDPPSTASMANLYTIETPQGTMTVRLYDETPLHRDNFKRLVDEQFYDSTLFHRVISGFMIQGGDPNTRDDDDLMNDGQGGPGYTVPAEFVPSLIHRKGALAAARQGDNVNPERASSGSQFYIVQGQPFPEETIAEMEQRVRQQIGDTTFTYSDEQRQLYATLGGYPPLDMQYTVFGEVVEGLEVLDRIASSPTPNQAGQRVPPPLGDRPLEPVWMVIRPAAEAL
ncbi:MAG: peptidylprolyl isomerase [Bacteroidota bacterium]